MRTDTQIVRVNRSRQFSLADLFGLTTAVCVCLGVAGLLGTAGLFVAAMVAVGIIGSAVGFLLLMVLLLPVGLLAAFAWEGLRRFVWYVWDDYASDRVVEATGQFSNRLPAFLLKSSEAQK